MVFNVTNGTPYTISINPALHDREHINFYIIMSLTIHVYRLVSLILPTPPVEEGRSHSRWIMEELGWFWVEDTIGVDGEVGKSVEIHSSLSLRRYYIQILLSVRTTYIYNRMQKFSPPAVIVRDSVAPPLEQVTTLPFSKNTAQWWW